MTIYAVLMLKSKKKNLKNTFHINSELVKAYSLKCVLKSGK